jgi:glucoamylase
MGGLLGVPEMVRRAAGFLVRQGPVTPQDRWEESEGLSPLTLAVQIAALAAAPRFLDDPAERAFAISFADYLNERIEDWTYVEQSELARRYGVAGHYVRINPASVLLGRSEPILIANTRGKRYPPEEIVSLEFLGLAHLGLRPADDPKLAATWKIVDAELGVDTSKGRAYHRYTHDGYGEHADGSPFDIEGVGRLWPLLIGEVGHFALLRGEDATPHLDAMRKLTGRCGLMPEQVWGHAAPAGVSAGEPTGSAMPLLWTHSEFLKLVYARKERQPIEQLEAVKVRYLEDPPQAEIWHWRPHAPFTAVPRGRKARIELPLPFRLRFGFDGWRDVADLESARLGFGLHGVLLGADALQGRSRIDFTYWNRESQSWAGVDYGFAIR